MRKDNCFKVINQVFALILLNVLMAVSSQIAYASNPAPLHYPGSSDESLNFYFVSSRTGNMQYAAMYDIDNKGSKVTALNTNGTVYIYVGKMADGRAKWSTFDYQPIYEEIYSPGMIKPIRLHTGKFSIAPSSSGCVYTSPKMTILYTISDTYDKRISNAEGLKRLKNSSGAAAGNGNSSTNSTSARNSNTYQKQNRSEYVKCRHCGGTGRCSTCNGTGDRGDSYNREPNKTVWKCTTCSGSGKCMFCHGTGHIRN